MHREIWRPSTAQAPFTTPWLRPLIMLLYASAAIGVLFQYWLVPILNLAGTGVSFWTGFSRLVTGWVDAGATIALLWTLWEANGYLQRRAQGMPWGAATQTFLLDGALSAGGGALCRSDCTDLCRPDRRRRLVRLASLATDAGTRRVGASLY